MKNNVGIAGVTTCLLSMSVLWGIHIKASTSRKQHHKGNTIPYESAMHTGKMTLDQIDTFVQQALKEWIENVRS